MSYKVGDGYFGEFTTQRFDTGAATDADTTPVAIANKNGADDGGFALTVAKIETGRYTIRGTIPAGYTSGTVVNISVAASVNGVAGKAVTDSFICDAKRLSDLNDIAATGLATLATQTSILSAISGVTTNTARSMPVVPECLIRPSAGSISYQAMLYLYNLQGVLEDADANAIAIHARTSAGASRDGGLTATTMVRVSVGKYVATYSVASTDADENVYFDFTWAVGGTAMADSAVSLIQDTQMGATLAAVKAKTDLIATNDGDSPNAATTQSYVAAIQADYQQRGQAVTLPGGVATEAKQDVAAEAIGALTAPDNTTIGQIANRIGVPAEGHTIAGDVVAGTSYSLTDDERNAIADALLSRQAIDGRTVQELLRYLGAVLAGKVRGAGTANEVYVGLDGATDRIAVQADSAGNRIGVTYDPPVV